MNLNTVFVAAPAARRLGLIALTTVSAALFTACGGGGDNTPAAAAPPPVSAPAATVQITGLAATGGAIANATVTAINVRGEKATAMTNAAGNYTLSVPDGAPYVLSVSDAAGKAWYSFAQAAGAANINPLTTLALLQANGNKPLSDLAAAWGKSQLTAAQVLDGLKVVNANFAALMQSKGVAAASLNPFVVSFSANGQGLDAVLDAMRVNINCTATSCTQTITSPSGSTLLSWNANIATGGITVSWSGSGGSGSLDIGIGSCRAPKAGTYSLVVQTTVSGLGALVIPEICVDGLPGKPTTQAEFCGNGTVTQQLPPGVQVLTCTYDGSTGLIAARITLPFVLDYSLKYSFVQR